MPTILDASSQAYAESLLPALLVHLDKQAGSDDDELVTFLAAAVERLERSIGPIPPTEAVDTFDCARRLGFVLTGWPVLTVDKVATWSGGVETVLEPRDLTTGQAGWYLVGDGGLLRLAAFPGGDLVVTYTAGRDPVPAHVEKAVLEFAGIMYRGSQHGRGGSRPQPSGQFGSTAPPGAFSRDLPNSVTRLIGPDMVPGV